MNFVNLGSGRIERCVGAVGASRCVIEHAMLNVDLGHLVATDGHVLVVSTVVCEVGDVSGYITTPAILAYRAALAKVPTWQTDHAVRFQALQEEQVITDNAGNVQTFRRPPVALDRDGKPQFPNYAAVLPTDRGEEPAFTFDFELLRKVVDALGYPETLRGKSSMVALFPASKNPREMSMLIKTTQNGPIGIVMPCRGEAGGWLTTVDGLAGRVDALRQDAAVAEQQAAVARARAYDEVEDGSYVEEPEADDPYVCDDDARGAEEADAAAEEPSEGIRIVAGKAVA